MFPFSISNAPGEGTIRISAKKAGDFTTKCLPRVMEGDPIVVMGPYGRFGERFLAHRKDMLWVAGGIGITPFLSMAEQESKSPTGRSIDLVWTVRHAGYAKYMDELERRADSNEELRFHLWLSGECGRMKADYLQEAAGGLDELRRRLVFLCGPAPMMKDMARQLISLGVHPRNILFEDFNLL